ncbi:hypothetical protein [Caulobacter sp. 3R27C2-B]|jgi:hypothetical protein|uniref:hypothetical protein n=1 Tax=Caulobacter sp. 3R27C2-B TaxID=2502219 RepID=UPI0010F58E52|nr:hypothetical protein [Caulobacter sp. 3R27C2-B]
MNAQTQAALDEIAAAIEAGQKTFVPAFFSRFFGRGATAAAFRIAKERGLIEVAYQSMAGTPVYRPAAPGQEA